MNNQFWSNFFRKDLNLSNRWWHRLFLVIFFFYLAFGLYTISQDRLFNNPEIPQWKISGSVEERLTPEVKQIKDLKKNGEQVVSKDTYYLLNSEDNSFYDDFYCSTNLENKISEIQNKSGITNLYLNRKKVSIEVFENYMRDNDVKCIIPDAYTNADNTKLKFLEPYTPGSLYGEDLVFYEKSNLLTMLYILETLSFVIAVVILIFAGIVIVYYKVFIYIVFGKKKNN